MDPQSLIYPSQDAIYTVKQALSEAPPPVEWRVVERAADTRDRFQILLDDDRTVQVAPDPDPRYYTPGGTVSLIDVLFYFPRRVITGEHALDLVHRFTDKLNWNMIAGRALVDNDQDLAPHGSVWLKHIVDLRGGVTPSFLTAQVDAFIASMDIVRRLHEADPESPLEEGPWLGREPRSRP
ncbi:MAG: YbjN domain-containing protein [Chloroflexota bacterium]